MTTFADKILSEPCDHNWKYISSNWMGANVKCIYCDECDYIANEVRMTDC